MKKEKVNAKNVMDCERDNGGKKGRKPSFF
jgi:hypothetical protein